MVDLIGDRLKIGKHGHPVSLARVPARTNFKQTLGPLFSRALCHQWDFPCSERHGDSHNLSPTIYRPKESGSKISNSPVQQTSHVPDPPATDIETPEKNKPMPVPLIAKEI